MPIHQFNYRISVDAIKLKQRLHIFKVIKNITLGYAVLVILISVYSLVFLKEPFALVIEKVVFMLYLFMAFIAYQYFRAKRILEADIGLKIVIKYTAPLAENYPSAVFVEDLYALKGYTYSQLDSQAKALLAKAVLDKIYAYEWVFSIDDLRTISKAKTLSETTSIMQKSQKIIDVKDKLVNKRYNKGYRIV